MNVSSTERKIATTTELLNANVRRQQLMTIARIPDPSVNVVNQGIVKRNALTVLVQMRTEANALAEATVNAIWQMKHTSPERNAR